MSIIILNKNRVTIRKARLSNFEAIFRMWKKMMDFHRKKFYHPYMKMKKNADSIYKKFLKKQFHNKNAKIFVAEFNGKIIAHAMFSVRKFPPVYVIDKEINLDEIFVEEKFRGKGIAQKLILEGRKWGKKKKIDYMCLEVLNKNKNAIKAYEKAGFTIQRHQMKDY